jgi:predicted permease
MSAIVLLLGCLAAGIVLQRAGKLPDNTPAALNAYIINVALPALALTHLHTADG